MGGIASVQLAAGERLSVLAPDLGSVEVWVNGANSDPRRLDRFAGLFSVGPFRYQATVQLLATGGDGEYSVLSPAGVVTSGPTVIGDNRVTVIGGTSVGSVLRARVGAGLEVSSYQWLRDGVAISGATSSTYTLTSSDQGKSITVRSALANVVAGPQNIPAAAPTPAPPASLLARVLGFGDSTMFGIDGNTATQTAAANRSLNILAAARGLTAYNAAISGTVLQDSADSGGSARAQNGYSRYVTDTLGSNASQVVVSNYGLNDLRYTGAPATMNMTNYLARYATIVDAWIAAGCEVILASPGWIPDAGYSTGSAGFTGSSRTVHEQYVAAVWQLAKTKGVKYAPVYERMKAVGATTVGSDNIHPTATPGYSTAGQAMIDAAVPVEASWPGAVADTTKPLATAAAVANGSPTIVAITFSEPLDTGFVPAASAFTVGGHTVSSVAFSGSTTLNLTCSAAFVNGEAARTLAYTQPGAGNLRDTSGNLLDNITSLSITNNVAAAGGGGGTATAATFSSTNASWRTVSTEKYDSSTGTSTFDGIAQVAGSVTVGTDAWCEMQFSASDAGGVIVLDPTSGLTPFANSLDRAYLVQLINDGRVFTAINNGVSAAMPTPFTFSATSATTRVRMHLATSGAVTCETTTDDGATWTSRQTLGSALTAGTVVYFKYYVTNARKLYQPRQSGVN